jgi:hypothetical protein
VSEQRRRSCCDWENFERYWLGRSDLDQKSLDLAAQRVGGAAKRFRKLQYVRCGNAGLADRRGSAKESMTSQTLFSCERLSAPSRAGTIRLTSDNRGER